MFYIKNRLKKKPFDDANILNYVTVKTIMLEICQVLSIRKQRIELETYP